MADHTRRKNLYVNLLAADAEYYAPRATKTVVPNRLSLHNLVADHIGRETDLRYLEFGVAAGHCMWRFSKLFTNPSSDFIGFDSFEGLPEAWHVNPAGTFSTGGKVPRFNDPRIRFIKGWFQNSVPTFLTELRGAAPKVTLVNFDADIYSATLFLLTALWWVIPEYFFIFDEFYNEELVALADFACAYPVDVEFYAYAPAANGAPAQMFGKLKATELKVALPPSDTPPLSAITEL